MKKIILIGNGFDLAHNMKTKHSDVFDFVKEEIIKDKGNEINYGYMVENIEEFYAPADPSEHLDWYRKKRERRKNR